MRTAYALHNTNSSNSLHSVMHFHTAHGEIIPLSILLYCIRFQKGFYIPFLNNNKTNFLFVCLFVCLTTPPLPSTERKHHLLESNRAWSRCTTTMEDLLTIHIHTYVPTYIHTYIHMYIHTYIHTYIHMYIRTYIRTYIYTFVRTYVRMYIRTYVCTYIHT